MRGNNGLRLTVLIWVTAVVSSAAGAQREATAVDRVYTAEQAERGLGEYTTWCAHCHRSDLLGDERAEIPALADESFFVRWEGRSVGALFDMISKDMPGDKPGGLSTRAYLDILAYVLQVNHYPAGTEELRADQALLKNIPIEKR